MTANTMCVSCLLSKQEKIISDYLDANKKSRYIEHVQEILDSSGLGLHMLKIDDATLEDTKEVGLTDISVTIVSYNFTI